MIIRSATASDVAGIAVLLGQLGYPATDAEVADRFSRLAARADAAVLVAERDGRAVGLATMHVITPINRPLDVAWITTLVVDEAERGTGVGRALVREVENRARAAGCQWLTVTTHEDRAAAHAFYAGVGFTLTGRRFGKSIAL